jgi:hypothetical protein
MPKPPAKLGNSFFGDSGTMFNENTRDEIEKNAGAGHPGNNVDIAQRYAQSEADEHTQRAERMTRDMERGGVRLGAGRDKFVADMAQQLRGGPATPAQPQEPEEAPSLSRSADDKFWNSEEPKKVMPRKL